MQQWTCDLGGYGFMMCIPSNDLSGDRRQQAWHKLNLVKVPPHRTHHRRLTRRVESRMRMDMPITNVPTAPMKKYVSMTYLASQSAFASQHVVPSLAPFYSCLYLARE